MRQIRPCRARSIVKMLEPNAVRVRAESCWPGGAFCACWSSFWGKCDERIFCRDRLGWMLLLDRPQSPSQQEQAQPGSSLLQFIRRERDIMDHDNELVGLVICCPDGNNSQDYHLYCRVVNVDARATNGYTAVRAQINQTPGSRRLHPSVAGTHGAAENILESVG